MSSQPEVDDQQDSLLPNREMAIRLPVFEGPLDLLLFLIRTVRRSQGIIGH